VVHDRTAVEVASLRYRPDIDGLRAVAVLAVLGYHAFPGEVSGGYIGVDIFFVISGYLITGIIYRQMLEKRFSITDFYARRIRRIFPALIVVVSVTFAIGWFILPPRDMKSLGENIAGGALFAQNFVLLGQVGYFDLIAHKKPLLHLWSLGIEEQYYIVWPITLLLLRRWRSSLLPLVSVLTVVSFVLCVFLCRRSPELAFYLPFTRAWELFVGSALALWEGVNAPKEPLSISRKLFFEIVTLGSVLAIGVALWKFDPKTPYPGYFTLIPVLAATSLIGTRGTLVHRYVLSTRAPVFVGLISYPLYLWHFPLMAYARIHYGDVVSPGLMSAILVSSGVLAWLTYCLVERPIRFGRRWVGLKVSGLLAAMASLGGVGVVADMTNGLPIRIPASIRPFMLTGEETSAYWRRGKCLLLPEQNEENFAKECAGDSRRPLLFVWGDSYAASLYPGLNHYASEKGYSVAEFTASACPPLIGFTFSERPFCKGINDYVLKRVSELKPDTLIFYSTWSYPYTPNEFRQDLTRTISLLRPLDLKKIVMLGPIATWKGDGLAANVLDYYFESGTHSVLPERTLYRSNDDWTRALDTFMRAQARDVGIEYISTRDVMCDDDGCLARIGPNGSELTAYDGGHLTVPGSVFLARHILGNLLDFKDTAIR